MRNLHEGSTGSFLEPVRQVPRAWNLSLQVPGDCWNLSDRFHDIAGSCLTGSTLFENNKICDSSCIKEALDTVSMVTQTVLSPFS